MLLNINNSEQVLWFLLFPPWVLSERPNDSHFLSCHSHVFLKWSWTLEQYCPVSGSNYGSHHTGLSFSVHHGRRRHHRCHRDCKIYAHETNGRQNMCENISGTSSFMLFFLYYASGKTRPQPHRQRPWCRVSDRQTGWLVRKGKRGGYGGKQQNTKNQLSSTLESVPIAT